MKSLLKKLFCSHDFELVSQQFAGIGGTRKIFIYKCRNCGKTKTVIV